MSLDMNNNMMHTEVSQWVSEADPKHKVGELFSIGISLWIALAAVPSVHAQANRETVRGRIWMAKPTTENWRYESPCWKRI